MAAAAVLPVTAPPKNTWTPVIQQPKTATIGNDPFSAKKHLNYVAPSKIYSMKDLGLPEDQGISQTAVSEPFPLFTEEAVMRMRKEILSDEVFNNCQYSSDLAQCQLRGYASKYAPFTYDAWKDPSMLAIISKIAGIDLVTEMDFEIAHINISVKSQKEKAEEIQAFNDRATQYEADEGIGGCPWEDDAPIVNWHHDSYPFVCVTMLSDCTDMIGGETALRMGTGEIMKVRGPQMGHAVVLQGRYIEHQALRTLGAAERISMVTSFRPRCPKIRDDTVLTTVRGISDPAELYHQFTEYRLEMLEERIRQQLKEIRECNAAKRFANTRKLKAFLREQERFLAHMNHEMIIHESEDVEMVAGGGEAKEKEVASAKKRPRVH